ncbi:MAG TPA: EVE domain-containing protein [Bacillales bacterium]
MTTEMEQFWFMVASDTAESFRWAHILENQGSTFWWMRKMPRNFRTAWEGDLILCYRSGSEKRGLVGLAEVEEGFNGDGITVKGLRAFQSAIPYDDFKNEPIYKTTEAGRMRNRGTLFAVHKEFVSWVKKELTAAGDLESAAVLKI